MTLSNQEVANGPKESWWMDAHRQPRETFYQQVAHHDATRFRLQSRHGGSFETTGSGRMSRPRPDRGFGDE